jgi:hypothetical protein
MVVTPKAAARRRMFWRRMVTHGAISVGLLGASLVAGMVGYRRFEHMSWTDAFVNASMLLSGMGPIKTELSESGKVFAGVYALYSGIVVIAVAGLLLAPAVHRLMHRVHWDDEA